jgi:rsbT co-antagonist protein RsbR
VSMPNSMKYIGEKLKSLKLEIAEEIAGIYKEKYNIEYTKLSKEKMNEHIADLVTMFADGFIERDSAATLQDVHNWGREFGKEASGLELSPERAILVVPILRKVVYKYIREEFAEGSQTFDQYYEVADTINPLIDKAIYSFTQSYVERNERKIQEAKDEILNLSVPVVPLTKEVAILPIIGHIDSKRSQELLNQALLKGKDLKLSALILDLSGVHLIDTYVAQNLFQLNDALQIIGVRVIFSGLRPELAQTLVNLGISFDHMTVVNSLPQALKKTGLSVNADR